MIIKTLAIFSFFLLPFGVSEVFAEESETQAVLPFRLPQTSLYFASSSYQVQLSNAAGVTSGVLDRGGINTYGFDIEINSLRMMNIGAYFRAESIKLIDPRADISMRFATTLGGFVRFFYAPSFLTGKVFSSNVFTRLELGGGPLILGQPMGIMGQTGVYVGVETYVTKWFGVSVSYGRTFEYGKETLIGDKVIWNRGEVISVALKTTYF